MRRNSIIKKITAISLSLFMALTSVDLSALTLNVYAAEGITEDVPDLGNEPKPGETTKLGNLEGECIDVETLEEASIDESDFDYTNEELFEMYAGKTLGLIPDISAYSLDYSGNHLDEVNKYIYEQLKIEITKIANGERDSSEIVISLAEIENKFDLSYTSEELGGIKADSEGNITKETLDSFSNKLAEAIAGIDMPKVLDALINDCPYECYWYMKSKNYKYGSRYSITGDYSHLQVKEGTLKYSVRLPIDPAFKANDGSEYSIDTSLTGAAKNTAAYAKTIVEAVKKKSDYEKLDYYREQICKLNTYNRDAADRGSLALDSIAPWQLIYVFDQNPATNVVCEGYSKAFAYLCELTSFKSREIRVYLVSGDMTKTLDEKGPHMWNIVHMDDGKNYLVDVTNCDGDSDSGYSVGYPDKLFMRGTSSEVLTDPGNEVVGYRFDIQQSSLYRYYYVYDSDTLSSYSWDDIKLNSTDYDPEYKATVNPEVESYTCSTVTLKSQDGYEYSMDGTSWQSSNVFTGLEDSHTYNFYQRIAASGGNPASESKSIEYRFSEGDHNFGSSGTDIRCAYCSRKNIAYGGITVTVTNPTYLGSTANQRPEVKVADGSSTLRLNTDYILNIESHSDANPNEDYTFEIIGKGDYVGSRTATWNIEKIASSVKSTPTGCTGLVYNGNPQELIYVRGDASGGTIVFSLAEDGEYSSNYPTGTDAGTYTIWYKVKGDKNHSDSAPASMTVKIAKKKPSISVEKTYYTKSYLDEPFSIGEVTHEGDGVISYSVASVIPGETAGAVTVDETGKITIHKPGQMRVHVSLSETTNYSSTDATISVFVKKAEARVTKTPKAKSGLVYTGEEQTLLDAGEVNGGTLVYSLAEDGEYSTEIPKGTNAGLYTVWYKIIGNDYFQYNTSPKSVNNAYIGYLKGEIVVPTTNYQKKYGDEPFDLGITSTGDGTVSYSSTNTNVATVDSTGRVTIVGAGDAYINAEMKNATNYSYQSPSRQIQVRVDKIYSKVAKKPTAKILTYNGEYQTLLNEDGVAEGGTLVYSMSYSGEFTTTIPTRKEAGTHYVFYKVKGDRNHNDSAADTVEVVISRANPELSVAQTVVNKAFGDPMFKVDVTRKGNGSISYSSSNPSVAQINEYSGDIKINGIGSAIITVSLAEATNDGYLSDSKTFTVNVGKGTQNALSVSVEKDTCRKIRLQSHTNYEYSLDGETWQDSSEFAGLTPGKEYTFYQRAKETDKYVTSAPKTLKYIYKGSEHDFGSGGSEEECIDCGIKNLNFWRIDVTSSNPDYTGSEVIPAVVVSRNDNDTVLAEGVDYTVNVVPQVKVKHDGVYSLEVRGIGDYTGTVTKEWNINKASANLSVPAEINKTYGDAPFTIEATRLDDGFVGFWTMETDIVSIEEITGKITILRPGTAYINVNANETDNTVFDKKKVKLNIARAPHEDTEVVERSHSYKHSAEGCIDLSEFLPADAGSVMYSIIKPLKHEGAESVYVSGITDDTLWYHANEMDEFIPGTYTEIAVTYITANYEEFDKVIRINRTECSHPESEIVIVNRTLPTCEETGLDDKVCSACGTIVKSGIVVPATGHRLSEYYIVDKAPTCTEAGSESNHCLECNKSQNSREISALGHDWDEGVITLAATRKNKGIKTFTCRYDNSHVMTQEIPTLDQKGSVVKEDLDDFTEEDLKSEEIRVVGVHDAAYTGSAITFDLRVYKGNMLLKDGTDYSVAYKNNKNAFTDEYSETTASKMPKVIVKGKGAFRDINESIYFKIDRVDLMDNEEVIVSNDTVTAGTKTYKPVPTVTINGKKLKANTDFIVIYDSEHVGGYKSAGTYEIKLEGKGNYSGELTSTFRIIDPSVQKLISKATVSNYAKKMPYDGTAKKQDFDKVTVKIGKGRNAVQLIEGIDFTVSYMDNIEIGTASMIIKAAEDSDIYAGEKVITYKITGTAMSKAQINYNSKQMYTGEMLTPVIVAKAGNGDVLHEGVDYNISYAKNINVGKASIIITGIGAYTGTVKKTFKIQPIELKDNDSVNVELIGSPMKNKKGEYVFEGDSDIEVEHNGKLLIKGVDYTVKYKNNKVPALATDTKAPTITISGKGNYAKSVSVKFDIADDGMDE